MPRLAAFVLALLTILGTAGAMTETQAAQGLDPENTLYLDTQYGRVVIEMRPDLAPQALHRSMHEALERADAAIEQRASKERDLEGMGTTAVIAAINQHEYVHCYLGDSRLYHIRHDEVIYHTKDHSVVRFLVEEGIIGPEEAKDHPYRSQLTSSLGGGPNANRLTIEPKWDGKDAPRREWQSGDWLILCSDGLNSELEGPA